MRQKGAKLMAILALFGIIISIIGVTILSLTGKQNTQSQQLTAEQLQEMFKNQTGATVSASGNIEITPEIIEQTGSTVKDNSSGSTTQ